MSKPITSYRTKSAVGRDTLRIDACDRDSLSIEELVDLIAKINEFLKDVHKLVTIAVDDRYHS